jgi:hypothetical protein
MPSTITLKLEELFRRFMISKSDRLLVNSGSTLVTLHTKPQPGTAWKSLVLASFSVAKAWG